MPGPGQADLQILSSKVTDMTRLQYQQDMTNRTTGEALVNREAANKEVERTQVQRQEEAQGGRVDRDGSRRQNAGQQQRREDPEQPQEQPQAKTMGYGRRLDITV